MCYAYHLFQRYFVIRHASTFFFVDPDESQLPESYFLDEEPILSSSSDSELPSGKATWEENNRK